MSFHIVGPDKRAQLSLSLAPSPHSESLPSNGLLCSVGVISHGVWFHENTKYKAPDYYLGHKVRQ